MKNIIENIGNFVESLFILSLYSITVCLLSLILFDTKEFYFLKFSWDFNFSDYLYDYLYDIFIYINLQDQYYFIYLLLLIFAFSVLLFILEETRVGISIPLTRLFPIILHFIYYGLFVHFFMKILIDRFIYLDNFCIFLPTITNNIEVQFFIISFYCTFFLFYLIYISDLFKR